MHPPTSYTTLRHGLLVLLLAAGSLLSLSANADWRSESLDLLIDEAHAVALARVEQVTPGAQGSEQQLATLSLRTLLKGALADRFLLVGNEHDPALPNLVAGTDLLVFVTAPDGEGISHVVGRDQGAIAVTQAQRGPTRSLLNTVIDRGAALRVAQVLQYLPAGEPRVPVALLAMLLEQLERQGKPQDSNAIRRLACLVDDYQPAAARLGISLAGQLAIPQARQCLERHALVPQGPFALDAIRALGDFADSRSAQVLATLLPAGEPKPFPDFEDAEELPGPGPADDPEEEGTPQPDPREESDDPLPPVTPEEAIDTGRDEDDGNTDADDDGDNDPLPPPGPNEENDDAPFTSQDAPLRGADGGVAAATLLALGKIGAPASVQRIAPIAREGNQLALHSRVVVALGLIASEGARSELRTIADAHPHHLVRELASQTLARLQN